MLTKELAIFAFDGAHVVPDRLTTARHAHYLQYAERMLAIYRDGIGRTRRELHAAIARLFDDEPACPPARIAAFCKLLDDPPVSRYHTDIRGHAARLRREVFRRAAQFHPLVESQNALFEHTEAAVKQRIAAELGYASWAQLEPELFADVIEYHRLAEFTGFPSPAALLSRYNVAQVQAALLYATRLTIRARTDFRRIITHAKLARLLHDIQCEQRGRALPYIITLTGPASVLRETRRYGAAMAKFLPALLACRDWHASADLLIGHPPRRRFLELDARDGLNSPLPPAHEFDTSLEQSFATLWGDKPRNGWHMTREGGVLHRGQTVMVPDFRFQHNDGRVAWLEIIGFWTPGYMQEKLRKLELFKDQPMLLAVAESLTTQFVSDAPHVLWYKSKLKLNSVLAALERAAPPQPRSKGRVEA